VDTKQQILLATIECIERHGLQNVTSRDIAAAAGANVAAVNYHFGTKQHLLDRAIQLTIDNGMDDFAAILGAKDVPFRVRLRRFYVRLLEGGRAFPNLTRAHLYESVVEGGAPGPFLRRLSALLQETLDRVTPDDTVLDRAELARAVETGMNSALMRCVHPKLIAVTPAGVSGVEEEARRLMRLIPD
jgi:AcrR family transcriptional regulator